MTAIRRLLAHRYLAVLLCAAAMLLRLGVPAGYMIGAEGGGWALTICSGVAGMPMAAAMPGMDMRTPAPGHHDEGGKADAPCPFAALSAPMLGGADPLLLAALVAFVVALGVRPAARLAPRRPPYARPPLRGPPARR